MAYVSLEDKSFYIYKMLGVSQNLYTSRFTNQEILRKETTQGKIHISFKEEMDK